MRHTTSGCHRKFDMPNHGLKRFLVATGGFSRGSWLGMLHFRRAPHSERIIMCANGVPIIATSNKGNLAHVKTDCDLWKCQYCRPKLEAKWRLHFEKVTADLDQVFVLTTAKKIWDDSIYYQAWRSGAAHFAVYHGEVVYLFFDRAIANAQPTSPLSAAKALALVLSDPSLQRRPISTSRGWSLPTEETEKRWTLVAIGPSQRAFLDAVKKRKVDVSVRTFGTDTFALANTAHCSDAERQEVVDLAKRLTRNFYSKQVPGGNWIASCAEQFIQSARECGEADIGPPVAAVA